MTDAFRAFANTNFRLWAGGALIANLGTWMLFTAQHWLVLTELTHRDPQALALLLALQSAPQLLLLPWNGHVADHFDRRKVLMGIQACRVVVVLALGLLTLTGAVRLWQVYALALMLGAANAFDLPARQALLSQIVPDADLANAVGINSTLMNSARTVGPALAGVLVAAVGCGWVFVMNSVCFLLVLVAVALMRVASPRRAPAGQGGGLLAGLQFVWRRPSMRAVLVMLFLVGTFGMNFPLYISTMAVGVFHADARTFGLLTSMMAAGSIVGAFFAAHQDRPRVVHLLASATLFALAGAAAACMPSALLFGALLVVVGASAQTFMTSTNSLVQLSAPPQARGRVLAIAVAVGMGFAPLGALVAGWVAAHAGPRSALFVAVAAGLAAAGVALQFLVRRQQLRVVVADGRLVVRMSPTPDDLAAPW